MRLINALRHYEVGLPLTYRQFEEVGVPVILEMLMRRGMHLMASRVAEFMKVPRDSILVHWACKKIKRSSQNEDEISRAIISKLQILDGVSFAKIAETAFTYGQKKLAIKVDINNPNLCILMLSIY